MRLIKTLSIAFALILIAASASYAGVGFTSTSTLQYVAPNARTGLASNIVFTALSAGTVGAGEVLVISYGGAQIAELSTIYVGYNATIPFGNGSAPANAIQPYGTPTTAVSGLTVTVNTTNIVLTFGTPYTVALNDTFTIAGVRLNVVPITTGVTIPAIPINATVTSVLGQFTVTNPIVPVVTFADPIAITATGAASVSTGGVVQTATATVKIAEVGAFTNAFETVGNAAADATELIVTLGSIPTGVILTGVAPTISTGTVALLPTFVIGLGLAGPTINIPIMIQGQSSTTQDTITVVLTFATAFGASNIPIQSATATATLGPEATAGELAKIVTGNATGIPFNAATNAGTGGDRYYSNPKGPVTVLGVVQLVTEMLSVLNSYTPNTSQAVGIATAYAISNSSGFLGIAGQAGTITVKIYSGDGATVTTFTTSATNKKGSGLDTNGNLPAGGTWTVLLSDILSMAGLTGSAPAGMIRFTCNFVGAHGVSWIADGNFAVYGQGYQLLVLDPTTTGTYGRVPAFDRTTL